MSSKLLKKIFVFVFFSFVGIVYLHNLTRDIYSGDIGDLVTAGYVFGVAHPPGYPLFSFLGYIFSHLPIPLPVVSKIGLISVFSSLAGLILYYKFSLKVSKSIFISLLSTSILAFSYLFWLTAEIPEGLGLTNFFVIAILYFAIKFYEGKKTRDLNILALFIGLSMTHQFYIFTMYPAVIFLIIKHYKLIISKKYFWSLLIYFLLGLAVYAYVPIAASRNPPINWDNAVNLKNFLHLILRKDYGGISYGVSKANLMVRLINVYHYLNILLSTFSYQIIFVILLGILKLVKKGKIIIFSLVTGFLFSGPITYLTGGGIIYSDVNWGVAERYYSISIVILMFFIPYGFLLILNFLNTKFSRNILSYFLLSYFLIIPILLFKYNYPKTNLSRTKIGNTYASNILYSIPLNSVLFLSGDTTTFNIWYLYYVLKLRQDIKIINPYGVGNNIYLDEEINKYYKEFPKTRLNQIITNTIGNLLKTNKIYSVNETVPLPNNYTLLPLGLIYQIVDKNNLPSKKEYVQKITTIWNGIKITNRKNLSLAEQNFVVTEIPFLYARGLTRIGDFIYTKYNDPKAAASYYLKAIFVDENFSQAYSGLALSVYKIDKDCSLSLQNITRAIELYPAYNRYYLQKQYLLKVCQSPKEEIDKFNSEYKARFK